MLAAAHECGLQMLYETKVVCESTLCGLLHSSVHNAAATT